MSVMVIDRFPSGAVMMPPSKSVAHRTVICACLAEGESLIDHIDMSQDIEATVRCMRALGAQIDIEGSSLRIRGGLRHEAGEGGRVAHCGESGSTLRFLIPLAALGTEAVAFTGHGRLMERPLTPYVEALGAHGASLDLKGGVLTVRGPLSAGEYTLPGDVSSQFVTGLLLALPLLEGPSRLVLTSPLESAAYVDITLEVMARFGVTAEREGGRVFHIAGGQRYGPQRYTVEGDFSQAAFFMAAGALGRPCECLGLPRRSAQGDAVIMDILRRCGAQVETTVHGGVTVSPGALRPQVIDVSGAPDLAPPLAALLCCIPGESRLTGARRLRIKESDRLRALASELAKLGARIEEGLDSLTIRGVERLNGGRVHSWGDHRIAMAMAVAAVRCDSPVEIEDWACVAKSYPGFFEDFCREGRDDTQ